MSVMETQRILRARECPSKTRIVISRSHRLYRQHHAARELFTCVNDQDVCDWDFNGDLEFDEVPGTTAVEEVEREEDAQEAT